MKKCKFEYDWQRSLIVICGKEVDTNSKGVWNGSEFAPVCHECLENRDIPICPKDNYRHFQEGLCPSCGKL